MSVSDVKYITTVIYSYILRYILLICMLGIVDKSSQNASHLFNLQGP